MKTNIGLVVVASALLLTGCSTTSHTTKWEYRQVSDVGTDYINQMADEGWIVAGFGYASDGGSRSTSYLLKRPKK